MEKERLGGRTYLIFIRLFTITAISAVKQDANIIANYHQAPLLLTQALLPHLAPASRIINISSVGSRAGFAGLSVYCSSKAAIEGLTRCWAAELGKNGTTVNAVNPGPVQSAMLGEWFEGY